MELNEKGRQISRELKDIHLMTATEVPLEHLIDISRKLKTTSYIIDSYLFDMGIKQTE